VFLHTPMPFLSKDTLSKDIQGKILSELTDVALGHMLFASKSTHLEATRVLFERMQAARVVFNNIHAELAKKYTVNCWFVKPDETLVDFSQVSTEHNFTFHGKLRVELKKPGVIEAISDTRKVDAWQLGPARRLHYTPNTGKEHVVLCPRTKEKRIRVDIDLNFHLRPYPADPAAMVCSAFDDGMWL